MSALGLVLGTSFEPRNIGLMFGFVVLPITFLGGTYYPWTKLSPVKVGGWHWLQTIVLVNPLIYVNEGMRAAFTPVPHMHLYVDLPRAAGLLHACSCGSGCATSAAASSANGARVGEGEGRRASRRADDRRLVSSSTRCASVSPDAARWMNADDVSSGRDQVRRVVSSQQVSRAGREGGQDLLEPDAVVLAELGDAVARARRTATRGRGAPRRTRADRRCRGTRGSQRGGCGSAGSAPRCWGRCAAGRGRPTAEGASRRCGSTGGPGECPGVQTARRSQPGSASASPSAMRWSGGAMRTNERICMEDAARSGTSVGGHAADLEQVGHRRRRAPRSHVAAREQRGVGGVQADPGAGGLADPPASP